MKEQDTGKRQKSVAWAKSGEFMEIKHLNDMLLEEVHAIWYNHTEFRGFKRDCHVTINIATAAFQAGKRLPSMVCDRGLEYHIDETRRNLRRSRRQMAVEAVLAEQYDQELDGLYSPEFIAEVYRKVSLPAHFDAHKLALQYEKEMFREINTELIKKVKRTRSVESIGYTAKVGRARKLLGLKRNASFSSSR